MLSIELKNSMAGIICIYLTFPTKNSTSIPSGLPMVFLLPHIDRPQPRRQPREPRVSCGHRLPDVGVLDAGGGIGKALRRHVGRAGVDL